MSSPRPKDARSSSYLPTLDGWRAFAILLVMFDHGGDSIDAFLRSFTSQTWHVPHALLHRGQMGVYVFFGLSGFLITSRLLAEHDATNDISLKRFYLRRLFRVFPPMWVYLAVAAVLAALAIVPISLSQWISAATFLSNYNADRGWYLGHFWSLAVEEHFYLLWPAALVFLRTRRALVVAIALTLLIPVWRYLVMTTGFTGWSSNLFSRTDLVLDTLLLGSVAAIVMRNPRFKSAITNLPAVAFWIFAALVGVTVIIRGDFTRLPQSTLLVLMMLFTLTHPTSLPGKILENAVLRWIGRLSYSLYVWQQLFVVWAGAEAPALAPLQTFPLNIIAAFACAIPSYYLVEKTLVKVGHRVTSR